MDPHRRPHVRLVATDLDGTLLDPFGRVTARTAASVRAARRAGIHVVAVTGRPPQSIWPITDAAGLGPLAVCSNGAAVVDVEHRSVLRVDALAGLVATRLVDLVRAAVPAIRLAADDLTRFTYERGFFEVPVDWQEQVCEVVDIRPLVSAGACVKLIGRVPGRSARELIEQLQTEVAEEAHITTSGLDWVDIGGLGVSKAFALQDVCERLGVAAAEVAAVGDNHNDLSLLGWAAVALAPSNAIAEVRAMATRILPSNAEDGVAVLLEELTAATLLGA
ncbi:MAG: HAD family hydrolase [Acidimicrobiales bacterium]